MTVRVEQSVDDPVVTFIFEGMPDQKTVREINEQAGQYLDRLGRYYAILDIRGLETTYGEIMALFAGIESPNIFNNKRVTPVFVGKPVPHDPTDSNATPIFESRDAAREYVQREIASSR